MTWRKARKRPIVIEFREVEPEIEAATRWLSGGTSYTVLGEKIFTAEGVLIALPDEDFIIRGVKGEVYPIKKAIFYETYDVLDDEEVNAS